MASWDATGPRVAPAVPASPPPGGTATATCLTEEQLAAARAPLGEALLILAAAGTGKTLTMVERVRYALEQGVPAEAVLMLTFSRRAQTEFAARLRRMGGGAEGASVFTFHSLSWEVLRHHWREAGFERRPAVVADTEQQLAIMRDCLLWDRLSVVQAAMRGWLFLPASASWQDVVAAAAERQAALYAQCLDAALAAFCADEPLSGALPLPAAAALPFSLLPPRLQLLLLCELHAALGRSLGGGRGGGEAEGGQDAREMLAAAGQQAPLFLSWAEQQKRQGRVPDEEAFAALCAADAAAGGSSAGVEARERQRQLLRVAAAFQAELRCLALVPLADLPLLARRLLAAGGEAARWARERWRLVLVDEWQDTAPVMLDLLALLLGERRCVTAVGDDDQAIYSFLHASPAVFEDFKRRFGARQLCLQANFRSSPAICAFASSLLHGNHRQADKRLLPARSSGGGGTGLSWQPVVARQFGSPWEEGEALAAEVQRLWREEGVPYGDVAALYRCLRLQGGQPHEPLMAALRRCGIPFTVTNHDRLAEDPAVAALVAYLALAANPGNDPALLVVMELPHHGLGQSTRAAVVQQSQAAKLAGRRPPSLLECAEEVCSQAAAAEEQAQQSLHGAAPSASQLSQVVSQLPRDDLAELRRIVQLLRRTPQVLAREPLPQAVQSVLCESGLAAWLRQQQRQDEPDAEDRACCGPAAGQDVAEALPRLLRSVLQQAERIMAEWQGAQQGGSPAGQAAAQVAGEDGSWGGAAQQAQQASSQEAELGRQLVAELLTRLAMEAAVDGSTPGCASPSQGSPARGQAGGAAEQPADPGVLTISTIHAAKGLEWPVVLLPSANEGHLPAKYRPQPAALAASWQAGGADGGSEWQRGRREHLEEERRLFHVAATRARDQLLIGYVQPTLAAEEPDDGRCSSVIAALAADSSLPQDLADLPRCSCILAGAARRLRRQQPGVLDFAGRLPEEDFPEWLLGSEEPGNVPSQPMATSSSRVTTSGDAGGSAGHGGSQLSVAERCRQTLAARGGTQKAASRLGARKRPVALAMRAGG